MTDPRKPIYRPGPQEAEAEALRRAVHGHLLTCTERGAKEIRCTGASFVTMGIGLWAAELADLDASATTKLLAALADLFDPASSEAKRAHAERRRRAAVERLLAAVDIAMASPGGNT